MKNGKRSFLYLIVSDYPYGFGEPFLEDELAVIASSFEKIYLIIPEPFKASKESYKFSLPQNAEIIEFNIQINSAHKIFALKYWFSKAWRLERQFIRRAYKQKLSSFHLRVLTSYQANALAFEAKMLALFELHNHPKEKTTVYSYWNTSATLGISFLKARFPQINTVTRIHGWDCFYQVNPLNYLPFRPWTIQTLDATCPISEAGANYTREKLLHENSEKIYAHHLGISVNTAPPHPTKKPNRLRILSLAFISPIKRIDRIIDALALTKNCEIEWMHIGSSASSENEIQEYAEQKLSKLKHIEFKFLGELNKEQIFTFLRSQKVDVLICTSESEGIPVSMMEAIGFGLPIISVNVGGIAELVVDGENGELMKADASSSEIAAGLEKWAGLNENEFEILSSKAYSNYLQYFSASKNYLKFYSEILNP
jgi:colanic acid/amylovoran biosynthesis glycosyltransferase